MNLSESLVITISFSKEEIRTMTKKFVQRNVTCAIYDFVFILADQKIKKLTSPSAYMVRLYVNVQFQAKPLSRGTSSSQTKQKFPQKY